MMCAAPRVLDWPRPDHADVAERDEEEEGPQGRRKDKEANATNVTLQLGDGYPTSGDGSVTQGPKWATCFVAATEKGRVSSEGVIPPRNVLEEWVLRGERENLNAFEVWRRSQAKDAKVQCMPRAAISTEDVFCLECISHAATGALPFTPTSHLATTGILTFGGLHECLADTVGSGYCKKGTVAVAM